MGGRTLKAKIWINLALVAVAAALVLLVVFEPGKAPPKPKPKLTDMTPADVSQVTIRRPGEPEIDLERTDQGWRMTAPRELPASKGKIGNLVALAAADSQRSYPADSIKPAEAGLDKDSPSVSLNGATFTFGATDAINGWRYVKVGGTVHLVHDRFLPMLRQDALNWVDTKLLPEGAKLTGLSLPDVTLSQNGKGLWQVDPEPKNMSADAPVTLAQHWESARGLSVKALDKPVPEDAPAIKVQLSGDGPPIEFRILKDGDNVSLARPGWKLRYALAPTQLDDLTTLKTKKPEPGKDAGKQADDSEPASDAGKG